MNEDDKSSDLHAWIDPEMEARIVALVLGEASDFEREELERAIAETPELVAFKRQIEAVHNKLSDVVATSESDLDDEWKLSGERRKVLDTVFSGEMESPYSECGAEEKIKSGQFDGRWWQDPAKIAAAVVFMLGGGLIVTMTFYSLAQSETSASSSYGGTRFTAESSEVAALNYQNETWDFRPQNDSFGRGGSQIVGMRELSEEAEVGSRFGNTEVSASNLFFADADVDGLVGFQAADTATTGLKSLVDQESADIDVVTTASIHQFGGGRVATPAQIGHGGDAAGWADNDSLASGIPGSAEPATERLATNLSRLVQVEAMDGSTVGADDLGETPEGVVVEGFNKESGITNFALPKSEGLLEERELLTSVRAKPNGSVNLGAGVSSYDDAKSNIEELGRGRTSFESKLLKKPTEEDAAPLSGRDLALMQERDGEGAPIPTNESLFGESDERLGYKLNRPQIDKTTSARRGATLSNQVTNLEAKIAKVEIQGNPKTRDMVVRRELAGKKTEESEPASRFERNETLQKKTLSLAGKVDQRDFSTFAAKQAPGIELPALVNEQGLDRLALVTGRKVESQGATGQSNGDVALDAGGALMVNESGKDQISLSSAKPLEFKARDNLDALAKNDSGVTRVTGVSASEGVVSVNGQEAPGQAAHWGAVDGGTEGVEADASGEARTRGQVIAGGGFMGADGKVGTDSTIEKESILTNDFTTVDAAAAIFPDVKKEVKELNKLVTGTTGVIEASSLEEADMDFFGGGDRLFRGEVGKDVDKSPQRLAIAEEQTQSGGAGGKTYVNGTAVIDLGDTVLSLGEPQPESQQLHDTTAQPGSDENANRMSSRRSLGGANALRGFISEDGVQKTPGNVTSFNNGDLVEDVQSGESSDYLYNTLGTEHQQRLAEGKTWAGVVKEDGQISNRNLQAEKQVATGSEESEGRESVVKFRKSRFSMTGNGGRGPDSVNRNASVAPVFELVPGVVGGGRVSADQEDDSRKNWEEKNASAFYDGYTTAGVSDNFKQQLYPSVDEFVINPNGSTKGYDGLVRSKDFRVSPKKGHGQVTPIVTDGDFDSAELDGKQTRIAGSGRFDEKRVNQELRWLDRTPHQKVDPEHAPGYEFGTTDIILSPLSDNRAKYDDRDNESSGDDFTLFSITGDIVMEAEPSKRKIRDFGFDLKSDNSNLDFGVATGFMGDISVQVDSNGRVSTDDIAQHSGAYIGHNGRDLAEVETSDVMVGDIEATQMTQWGFVRNDNRRPEKPTDEDAVWFTGVNNSLSLVSKLRGASFYDVGRVPVPSAGLDELSTADEAFSTFSLTVSDVSFKLAKAALEKGEWPEADKIRIEEFVNAFDYGDPLPSLNDKVASRVEQCIHPFLQQRNLVRVAMRTGAAGRAANTPLNLTFLLDNSGSMERADRQETVQLAFAELANHLKANDRVTLISFARQPRLLADKFSGDRANELVDAVKNRTSEGGTNLEAALDLAFEKAKEQQAEGAQNRIILLTDGAANLGDAEPEALAMKIESMREAGIAFDAAGIVAEGLNDEILEALTRKGDGRYYLLDGPENAGVAFAKQIAGALRPSAKNVKVQVEFNPDRVGKYKLLGFEKHRLKKEDFRNDSVDAAEMAAEETGVAVYQIEPLPSGEGDIGSVSVRFRDLSSGQMVEHRWPIAYQSSASRPDQSTASMRVATAAAMFAAKLKSEPLGEVVELEGVAALLEGLPESFSKMERVTELRAMISKARELEQN